MALLTCHMQWLTFITGLCVRYFEWLWYESIRGLGMNWLKLGYKLTQTWVQTDSNLGMNWLKFGHKPTKIWVRNDWVWNDHILAMSLVNHMLNVNIGLWCQNSGCLESACNKENNQIILKKAENILEIKCQASPNHNIKKYPPSNKYHSATPFSRTFSHIRDTRKTLC